VRNYLTTWFFIDLIASFPYSLVIDQIFSGNTQQKGTPQLLKLLKIVKFLRILRLLRLFKIRSLFFKVCIFLIMIDPLLIV
jgi:hypothetical protein